MDLDMDYISHIVVGDSLPLGALKWQDKKSSFRAKQGSKSPQRPFLQELEHALS